MKIFFILFVLFLTSCCPRAGQPIRLDDPTLSAEGYEMAVKVCAQMKPFGRLTITGDAAAVLGSCKSQAEIEEWQRKTSEEARRKYPEFFKGKKP